MPYATEKAWAGALARDISADIPQAVRNAGLNLTETQIAALRVAFEVRLVRTMGEDSDETPRDAATRNQQNG